MIFSIFIYSDELRIGIISTRFPRRQIFLGFCFRYFTTIFHKCYPLISIIPKKKTQTNQFPTLDSPPHQSPTPKHPPNHPHSHPTQNPPRSRPQTSERYQVARTHRTAVRPPIFGEALPTKGREKQRRGVPPKKRPDNGPHPARQRLGARPPPRFGPAE